MQLKTVFGTAALSLSLFAAACGGGDAQASQSQAAAEPAAPAAAAAGGSAVTLGRSVAPTGTVIEVQMVTDEKGNYYQPSVIDAKPGDVVRFALASGVHNVHFPAAQNAGAAGLPGPGDMLQLPGQTYEVLVGLDGGSYTFQCDPHAALGMTGTLNVQ